MAQPLKYIKRAGGFVRRNARRAVKPLLAVAAIAVCFVPAYVVNNAIGYLPGLMALFAVTASALYLQLLKRSLAFEEASRVSQCYRGGSIDFVLRLTNTSVLVFPRIEVVFQQTDSFGRPLREESTDITLAPHATRDFVYSMTFEHIGRCQAGLKRVVLHDLIGLFSYAFERESVKQVDVLPRTYALYGIEFDSEAPTATTAAIKTVLNEGVDYSQVRPYVWGDPIKAIHWNLSARFNEMMTRIYETQTNPGVVTIIDLHVPESDSDKLMHLFDAVVESALALDWFARSRGLDSDLLFTDDTGQLRRFSSRMQENGLIELNGLLRQDTSCFAGQAEEMVVHELNSPFGQTNIAVCTANVDSGILDTLITAKTRRRNPILLYALEQGLDRDERAKRCEPLRRLDGTGIACYPFASADEITKEADAQ